MSNIDFSRMLTHETRLVGAHRERLEAELATAEADLAASDWQVIRAAEGGPAMAPGLRDARAAARATISRLRADLAALPLSGPV